MIQDTFGYIAAEGHDPRLPMGVQTAPDELGERFLQFVDHGRIVHAFAQGPFAFVTEDGRTRSVDTSLAAVPGGWKPTSVPFSVTIPNDLSTGVVWQDGGAAVRIYPQNVNRTPGHPMAGTDDTILFEDAWNRSHMTLAATAEGVKDHIILEAENGVPNQFRFRVERPDGATTQLQTTAECKCLTTEEW